MMKHELPSEMREEAFGTPPGSLIELRCETVDRWADRVQDIEEENARLREALGQTVVGNAAINEAKEFSNNAFHDHKRAGNGGAELDALMSIGNSLMAITSVLMALWAQGEESDDDEPRV